MNTDRNNTPNKLQEILDSQKGPDLITEATKAAGGELFVVMNHDLSTVMEGPGGVPFHTTQRKIAEQVAREIMEKTGKGAFVRPLREAIKLVLNNQKNW